MLRVTSHRFEGVLAQKMDAVRSQEQAGESLGTQCGLQLGPSTNTGAGSAEFAILAGQVLTEHFKFSPSSL